MSVHDRILTVCLVKRNTNCAIFMNSVGRVLCPRFDVVSWASPLSSIVIISYLWQIVHSNWVCKVNPYSISLYICLKSQVYSASNSCCQLLSELYIFWFVLFVWHYCSVAINKQIKPVTTSMKLLMTYCVGMCDTYTLCMGPVL